MDAIRLPAASGSFYPDSPSELKEVVVDFLAQASKSSFDSAPKAIIAPHAGYIYSGPIAAAAYSVIKQFAGRWKRVAVIGPAHFVYLLGLGVPSSGFFKTPLGLIPVDSEIVKQLIGLEGVVLDDEAHFQEHSIEVQLPFLQVVLDEFSVVPILVGDVSDLVVANVIEVLLQREDLLVVVSSDLSHYLDYGAAHAVDLKTTTSIEELSASAIHPDQACGATPIRGLLRYAKKHNLSPHTLSLANSGDTAGDKRRVVGYGAYAFF